MVVLDREERLKIVCDFSQSARITKKRGIKIAAFR
jgi:hypothetical protein